MNKTTKNILKYLILSLPFVPFFATYPLMDNNEGLYAQIPVEMIERGDFIIPFLNGVPYLEKPPMLYWLIAIFYNIFGVYEWVARLPVLLSGLGLLWTTHSFLKKHADIKKADLFAYLLATSLPFIYVSHIVFFDVLLTFFFSNSLFCFYNWYVDRKKSNLFLSYSFLAFAALTKGLLSIALGGLIVILFFVLKKESLKTWKDFFNPFAILLFIIIFAPWHILASIQHEGFSYFYFINEHLLRFLDMREPRDYYRGPIYYYIPRILLFLLPWTFGVFSIFKRTNFKSLNLFLIIKIITIFIFFSISKAKANYYMILLIPSLIALIAIKLDEIKSNYQKSIMIVGPLLSIIVYASIWIPNFLYDSPCIDNLYEALCRPNINSYIYYDIKLTREILSIFGILGLIFSCYRILKGHIKPLSFVLFGPILMIYMANESSPYYTKYFSSKYFLEFVPKNKLDNIYFYKVFENLSSLTFYLKRPVKIIDSVSSDLWYGSKTSYAKNIFLDWKDFNSSDKYILTTPNYEKKLIKKGFTRVEKTKNGVLLYHPK